MLTKTPLRFCDCLSSAVNGGKHGVFRRNLTGPLAADLRQRDDVANVEVVQYPLDVRSDASVSGSTRSGNQNPEAAFKLKLVMGVTGGRQGS